MKQISRSHGRNILIAGLIYLQLGCGTGSEDQTDMAGKGDVEASDSISPERIEFEVAEHADFRADFTSSIEKGDFRFVGVWEFTLVVPGVPDYSERYSRSNGVKVIEGTSDSYEDIDDMRRQEFCRDYAEAYNKLMLEHLSRDSN